MPRTPRTVQPSELGRLARLIGERRAKAGLSQRALARKLGYNENVIWEFEAGRRGLQVMELIEIARVLGEDPSELLRLALSESEGSDS